MATEVQPAPTAVAAAPAEKKKTPLLAGIIVGGAIVGGLLAAFVVAPKLIARNAPSAVGAKGAAEPPKKEAEAGDPLLKEGKVVSLDNIIVNPAGSQGSRFLMTSVAFEVDGAEAEKALRAREVEVRDKVTSILEAQSLASLTSPGARDSLKRRIADSIAPMIGSNAKLHVYLPQFVIQ